MPDIGDEQAYLNAEDFDTSVRRLAEAKAAAVAKICPDSLVLGADTIVVCDGQALGKPRNREDAGRMLRLLSGREHTVCSGVALACQDASVMESMSERTSVVFRPIVDLEIQEYLATGEGEDKAGAYGIQGQAMLFVAQIHGCYYNVVGLPVQPTIQLLRKYSCC